MNRLPDSTCRCALLALSFLASPGCGSGESGGTADASFPTDAAFPCERDAQGGEPFDLALGLVADGEFQELSDGDQAPIVLGGQGLYMLLPDLQADFAVESETICLEFLAQIDPVGEYGGLEQPGIVEFRTTGQGSFRAGPTLILGGREVGEALDGATVRLRLSCAGHGLSGEVERELQLHIASAAPQTH